MESLIVISDETVTGSPDSVYAQFGMGEGSGWLFAAEYDARAVGSAVTLRLPVGGASATVDILGRIAGLAPGRQIVIAHDQPWRGRLRLRLQRADYQSTRVTVIAEVDERGVDWLARRRGWPSATAPNDGEYRIGLLTSKCGPGAVFAMACENMAAMAVDELNADGGLFRRTVRLLVGDDATEPAVGASEAGRLIRSGCRAVLAGVTSESFAAVERAVGGSGLPLIFPILNEGGSGGRNVFRWGERPADQLKLAARPLMRSTGGKRWFMVGQDYSWSHGAHRQARRLLPEAGGIIVGESLVPVGTTEFGPIMEAIQNSGADLVLSTLVGADEVAFERQSVAMGLRDQCQTLALVYDEVTDERMGDVPRSGIWTTSGYFQQLPTQQNKSFLTRYRQAFGPWAPPVSSLSESVYSAVHMYAAAARDAAGDDPADVITRLYARRVALPRGSVTLAGPQGTTQELHLAEAHAGGFRLLETSS